jgi:amidohydrolase
MAKLLPDLIELRRQLHLHPERSGEEKETKRRIGDFLEERGVLPLAEGIAGHGLLYRLDGLANGPVLLFRAEMDANPLGEESEKNYASLNPGLHHACGHDGHMAMLAGAILLLKAREIESKIFFLFQPGEETGQGMLAALTHPALLDLEIDRATSIHNLPGYPLGTVVLPKGAAAVASTGMRIALVGSSSHASEPYQGKNPIFTLADLVNAVQGAPLACLPYGHPAMITQTYLEAGKENYGSTPSSGSLGLTLRAESQEDLETLIDFLREQVESRARLAGLSGKIELVEPFPATINHAVATKAVERAAAEAGLLLKKKDSPFPWSEDFGYATRRWPGALVGLGAGENQPALHSPAYDFPDDLLILGLRFWLAAAA